MRLTLTVGDTVLEVRLPEDSPKRDLELALMTMWDRLHPPDIEALRRELEALAE